MIIIPCFFFRKRYRSIFFFYLVVAGLLLLSNIWYYRHFETAIPYTAFLMPENLDGLGPSILASMRIQDLSVVLPLISFVIFYYFTYASDKRDLPLCGRFGWVAVCRAIAIPVQLNAGWHNYANCTGLRIHILRHYGVFHRIVVRPDRDHTLYQPADPVKRNDLLPPCAPANRWRPFIGCTVNSERRAIACPVGNFLAALRYTDRQIGRFIDHLKKPTFMTKVSSSLPEIMNTLHAIWLKERAKDCALFRTGEVAGNNRRKDLVADKKRCWKISDLFIRSDYFRHNKLSYW